MTDVNGLPVWYELLTSDMKAAGAFYSRVVGWTVESFEGAAHPYDYFERAAGVGVAGVMNIPPGMNFPPHWEMYVSVPTVEEAVAKIERGGGRALGPLVEIPDVGRMRTMSDPQGAVFAIFQPAPGDQPREPGPPEVGAGSWHELLTTDAQAALRFYEDVFGWTLTRSIEMGPGVHYHLFGRNGLELGGMMTRTGEMADLPTAWGIYFRVPSVDAAVERIKANGGQIAYGPMDVPGGDRVVNGLDPQGAAFALHEKRS